MAEPSKKHQQMTDLLDQVGKKQFGRTRTESICQDICMICGDPATEFRDELSKREYTISGLCQKCQDSVFGSSE